MKLNLKSLIVSSLVMFSSQFINLPVYNSSILAMNCKLYELNGVKYEFSSNIISDLAYLKILSCPEGHLTRQIVKTILKEINKSLPLIQQLQPRALYIGKYIKKIDKDTFENIYLKNLTTLYIDTKSPVNEQIINDKELSNILKKLKVEEYNSTLACIINKDIKDKKPRKERKEMKYNKWSKGETDLLMYLLEESDYSFDKLMKTREDFKEKEEYKSNVHFKNLLTRTKSSMYGHWCYILDITELQTKKEVRKEVRKEQIYKLKK